jgi:hypothetical protein
MLFERSTFIGANIVLVRTIVKGPFSTPIKIEAVSVPMDWGEML